MGKDAEGRVADLDKDSRVPARSERSTLERFILRLRLVAAHSLAQDRELLERTARVDFRLHVVPDATTGKPVQSLQPIPLLPTEQLESAIARVRPLLMKSDGIGYGNILDSMMLTLNEERCAEVAAVLQAFREADPDSSDGRPRASHEPGAPVTDKQIAGAWIYGHLVHADAIRQSYTEGMSFESILVVAQRKTCSLILASLDALDLLGKLAADGMIEVDDRAFSQQVETRATEWAPEKVRVYSAPVGTGMPSSLDEPLGEEWEEVLPGLQATTSSWVRHLVSPGTLPLTGCTALSCGLPGWLGPRFPAKSDRR